MIKLLNLFAFTSMVTINILANALPIGGLTTAEVSALYPTLITPAGITFGIWGLIYLLIGIFVLLQFMSSQNDDTKNLGYLFVLSCGLNIAWILAWQFKMIIVAFLLIAALWVVLKIIDSSDSIDSYVGSIAFRIYYAWITAATLISLVLILSYLIPQLHLEANAIFITIAGLILLAGYAALRLAALTDIVFALVTAWAILGVFISHIGEGYNNMFPTVTIGSLILSVALTIAAIVVFIRKYFLRRGALQVSNIGK